MTVILVYGGIRMAILRNLKELSFFFAFNSSHFMSGERRCFTLFLKIVNCLVKLFCSDNDLQ